MNSISMHCHCTKDCGAMDTYVSYQQTDHNTYIHSHAKGMQSGQRATAVCETKELQLCC